MPRTMPRVNCWRRLQAAALSGKEFRLHAHAAMGQGEHTSGRALDRIRVLGALYLGRRRLRSCGRGRGACASKPTARFDVPNRAAPISELQQRAHVGDARLPHFRCLAPVERNLHNNGGVAGVDSLRGGDARRWRVRLTVGLPPTPRRPSIRQHLDTHSHLLSQPPRPSLTPACPFHPALPFAAASSTLLAVPRSTP